MCPLTSLHQNPKNNEFMKKKKKKKKNAPLVDRCLTRGRLGKPQNQREGLVWVSETPKAPDVEAPTEGSLLGFL